MSATIPSRGHWAEQRERGNLLLMRFGFWAARVLGRRFLMPVIGLVVFYFYLSGRQARRAIVHYQTQLLGSGVARTALPRVAPVYCQFLAFATALLDKLDVWHGKIQRVDLELVDPDKLHLQMNVGRGQILVTSHLGNAEITRALAQQVTGMRLNVLVHSRHAQFFNQLLAESGAKDIHLIEVSELDPALMLNLAQRLERGEWLAIAGDRMPIKGERTTPVQFLGDTVLFPQGPWLLAALLQCPANLLLCLRSPKRAPKRFRVILERLADTPPKERWLRRSYINESAQRYADRLAQYARQAPLQWFNFYSYWQSGADRGDK